MESHKEQYKKLKEMQSLPLKAKIAASNWRIEEWYKHWNGKVYISFSGGKDSTVLLDVVRNCFPDVPGVFVDTGLEYPEVKAVVKKYKNIIRIRPEIKFGDIVVKYGWPIVSKRISQYLRESIPTGKNYNTVKLRTTGYDPKGIYKSYAKISNKWLFLREYIIKGEIKVSEICCDKIKKNPIKKYEKETGRYPFIGMLASESRNRELNYLRKGGCNSFHEKRPTANPLSFWTEQDIYEYILKRDIPLAKVYGEIQRDCKGRYYTTGIDSTGCMFCMFGIHLENQPNRFQQMKTTHPKHWEYVINRMGGNKILDILNIPYNDFQIQQYDLFGD